jgi:membrane fusion protein, multidrug efflux system
MKATFRILISVFGLAVLAGCSAQPKVAADGPQLEFGLHTLQVRQQPVPDVFQVNGSVHSWRTASLSPQVMANVEAISVREGDTVKRGQVLIQMDRSQFVTATERGQAAVQAADHEIAFAQAEMDLAKSDFQRLGILHQKDIISARDYDQARAKLDSSTARFELARANREQAAAALNNDRIQLGYTRILAPFDGIVTERRVDPGVLAAPGVPLLTVEEAGNYRLDVAVDERDLKYLDQGETVQVLFDALSAPPLSARIVQIVPAADPASHSFVVKLDLPHNAGLRSGLFGRAIFTRGEKQAIQVPRAAVLDRGQLQSVYVLGENNTAMLRYVTLGMQSGDHVEVLSGLMPSEVIVSDPGSRDLAGKHIEVR